MERIIETTAAVSTEVVAGLGLEEVAVSSTVLAPVEAVEAVEAAPVQEVEETEEESNASWAAVNADSEEASDADLEHESKLESRLVKAGKIDESLDSLAGINAALRETILENGGDFQAASGIKHYNNIYKFLKRGEDFSLDMITSVATKLGFKIDVVITKVDEEVAGLADTNQEFIYAVSDAVNVVITEKFLATKTGAKAQESEEKKAARLAAKAEADKIKADAKAEKLAAKELAKKEAKDAKEAAKAEAKAAADKIKADAKAEKEAAKAATKAAEVAPVNLAEVDTIAIGADLLNTPVAELAVAEVSPLAELAVSEVSPEAKLAVETAIETAEEVVTGNEDLVADDSGVSATDGIQVNLDALNLNA